MPALLEESPLTVDATNLMKTTSTPQSATMPPTTVPLRRRRSLNEFYQNDAPRRTISETSSTHSKDTHQERWEWEEVNQILKPIDKGEEFISISRNADFFFNPTELIDVSCLPGT
jgi:hypothetical protein